jgi:hypothetical protein
MKIARGFLGAGIGLLPLDFMSDLRTKRGVLPLDEISASSQHTNDGHAAEHSDKLMHRKSASGGVANIRSRAK